jgi:malate/lactate dehydrogenase
MSTRLVPTGAAEREARGAEVPRGQRSQATVRASCAGYFVGVPCVLGKGGMEKIVEIGMNADEQGQPSLPKLV